jgi:hypothetical protein
VIAAISSTQKVVGSLLVKLSDFRRFHVMVIQRDEPRRLAVGRVFRRLMLALVQPAARSNRNLPPEFFKFPFF